MISSPHCSRLWVRYHPMARRTDAGPPLRSASDAAMYEYWSQRVAAGDQPTPRQLSEACNTSIHAARTAVRRYRSGIVPKPVPLGLAPKTVRNIHAFLHRALVDAVGWKYLTDNPASNVKPPRRPRTRRPVWSPEEIQKFLSSVRTDRARLSSCWN